jgi:GNAT superfamily N-acetyltransferase
MDAVIREYGVRDEDAVVEMALRAWGPVFASLERALGREISVRLHGEWRQFQAGAVRETLAGAAQAWVAEHERRVIGFAAVTLHQARLIGEISMLAVDPQDQRQGVGSTLTRCATEWLRDRGMRVAMIDTGGDEGHAAARRVYERADYTPLPVVRDFKAL